MPASPRRTKTRLSPLRIASINRSRLSHSGPRPSSTPGSYPARDQRLMLGAARMRAGVARSDSRGMLGESFQPDGQSGRLLREPRRDEAIVSRAPARPDPLADRRARIERNQLRRVYEPGEPAVMSQASARSGRPSSRPSASSAARAVPRGWRRDAWWRRPPAPGPNGGDTLRHRARRQQHADGPDSNPAGKAAADGEVAGFCGAALSL